MKNDKLLVEEIIDEIDDIHQFLKEEHCRTLNNFLSNNLLKKAVMMSIINIEEYIKLLSKYFIAKNSDIHFGQFREIRNVAAHKYGSINFVLIYSVIHKTLPKFKQQLIKILKNGQYE